MSRVFHANGFEAPTALTRVQCRNESTELQDRLEKQPELLAGDQLRPEDPRHWLQVRREMPVRSPTTALKEFSLDFLFVDQDAVPTFVEVKRCGDQRARREVIGQLLEYAANGRAYWELDDLVQAFLQTHGSDQEKALQTLREFRKTDDKALTPFFEQVVRNLRSGVMRLVFFLEDSSYELRSIVEFLNEEFETIEVVIVEARQYSFLTNGGEQSVIIVPHAVGFTEAVRQTKQRNQESKQGQITRGGEANFWAQISTAVDAEGAEALQGFIGDLQQENFCKVVWFVSAVVILPEVLQKRGLCGIRKSGDLEIYLGYWTESYDDIGPLQMDVKEFFVRGLRGLGLLAENHSQKFPVIPHQQWIRKAQEILSLLRNAAGRAKPALQELPGELSGF